MEAWATRGKVIAKEKAFFAEKRGQNLSKTKEQEKSLFKSLEFIFELFKKEKNKKESGEFLPFSPEILAYYLNQVKFPLEKLRDGLTKENILKESVEKVADLKNQPKKNFSLKGNPKSSGEEAGFFISPQKLAKEKPFLYELFLALAKDLPKANKEAHPKKIFSEEIKNQNLPENKAFNPTVNLEKPLLAQNTSDKKDDLSLLNKLSSRGVAFEAPLSEKLSNLSQSKEAKTVSLEKQLREILDRAFLEQRPDGTTHLEAKLYPKEYGTIRLTLNWQDGHVHVRMGVLNDIVKQEIQSVLENLRYDLLQRGIEIGSLEVFVSSQTPFFKNPEEQYISPTFFFQESLISYEEENPTREEALYA